MFWRRLFKKQAKQPLNAESLLQFIGELKEQSETDAYRLVLDRPIAPHEAIRGSKLGGLPYLDAHEPWPCNPNGLPYRLLLQLRCESLKAFKMLPNRGLLQFFITSGVPHSTNIDQYNHAMVRWIPVPLQRPEVYQIVKKAPKDNELPLAWPLKGSWSLAMELFKSTPVLGDCQAEKRFIDAFNRRFMDDLQLESVYDLYIHDPKLYELLFDATYHFHKHQVSGYPSFTGKDPRMYEGGCSTYYDTLLLQLDTDMRQGDKYIYWPDYGMAHFFINSEDLRQRNFSNILYSWAGDD